MVKENKLKKSLELNFKFYTPSLRSDKMEDREWAVNVLGKKYFSIEEPNLHEIMQDIEKIYQTEHHWFLMACSKLEFYIRYAFYNGMYDEDDLGSFFHKHYNESILMDAMNNREKSETMFDGIYDLFLKVLTELNYTH